MSRRFVIFQFPNRSLLATMAAAALAQGTSGTTARSAALARDAALLVWAAQELLDGANWFRRLVGVGGGALAAIDLERLATRRTLG